MKSDRSLLVVRRRSADLAQHRTGIAFSRQIAERHDSDDPTVLDYRDPPQRTLSHEADGVVGIVGRRDADRGGNGFEQMTKPSFVLVHGGNMSTETWNRFTIGDPVNTPDGKMGGRIWDPLLPELRPHAEYVFSPTLGDEHLHDLMDHVDQIASLVVDNDLHEVVFAGHSYGGMVITGAAARLADRVRGMVYVDAAIPDPGQSLFDILESGGRDPLSFPGLEASPPYVQKLWFDAPKWSSIPKTYVLCTESEFAPVTEVAKAKIASGSAGGSWTYLELPSWHVPMANMPRRVSEILLSM